MNAPCAPFVTTLPTQSATWVPNLPSTGAPSAARAFFKSAASAFGMPTALRTETRDDQSLVMTVCAGTAIVTRRSATAGTALVTRTTTLVEAVLVTVMELTVTVLVMEPAAVG